MYREFWNLFVNGYGRLPMASVTCGLAIIIAFLEGFNIGLLVPLLETLGSSDTADQHWITTAVSKAFASLGIPFELGSILLVLAGILVLMTGLRYIKLLLTAKLRTGFCAWMRAQYMANLLNADMSYFHQEQLGVMTDNLSAQTHHASSSVVDGIEILGNAVLVVAYLVGAFLISPGLTAAALGMVLLVTIAMQFFINRAGRISKEAVERQNIFTASAVETLGGIQVVSAFLLEKLRGREFINKAQAVGETEYQQLRNQAKMLVLQEMVFFGVIGGIVYVGVSVMDIGIAVIVALLFVLYRLMPKVSGLNNLRQSMAISLAKVHAVTVAMEKPTEKSIISGTTPFENFHDGIEIKDVSFSYNGGAAVLDGVGFKIKKGEMTAIVGASGAGKSTLIDLLLRYYDPVQGSISVDGLDLRELDLASWRQIIGVVSQDVYLFNETVAYNIGLDRPDISMDQISAAATRAYADEFIREMPQGYETKIGDRGWNMSGGQRQRIALARAIVQMPDILILDEATSSLDSESERLIQNYMDEIRGKTTMVVVAHRTATIRDADKIVVLQDGKIVEEGDWDRLMDSAGVFASNQHIQAGE